MAALVRRMKSQIAESTPRPPAAAPPVAAPPVEPRGVWAPPPKTPGIYAALANAGAGPGVAVKTESPRSDHPCDVISGGTAGDLGSEFWRGWHAAAAADGPLAPAPRDDAIAADGPLAPAVIVGHIDTPERSNEPIYAVIPGSNSGDSKKNPARPQLGFPL